MEVSNPDDLIFPEAGYTKRDLVAHYERVAPVMLPHLRGRPLTLHRFPQGVGASGFLQKNASRHFPDTIERVEVPKEDGVVRHPLVDEVDDLLYLANQRTVTFHIWASRLPDLTRPDRLVLDLDPPEGDTEAARWASLAVRRVLEEVGLDAGIMTTGSNGYHVVCRILPHLEHEAAGRMARLLAGITAVRHPDRLTVEFLKRERRGRVFVDWLRNRWAQTGVCAWSLRPKPEAPVATPIRWEELDETPPRAWTLDRIEERVGLGDPWPPPADLAAVADRIEQVAAEAGVSADEPFDRFGRRR